MMIINFPLENNITVHQIFPLPIFLNFEVILTKKKKRIITTNIIKERKFLPRAESSVLICWCINQYTIKTNELRKVRTSLLTIPLHPPD